MVGSRGLGAAGLDIVGRVRFCVFFTQSVVELELAGCRRSVTRKFGMVNFL